MRDVPRPHDEPIAVPSWVVSFGDMITNLLACFVLLLSLASSQDSTLFKVGMGSFRRVLKQYGLPSSLFSHKDSLPERDYLKIKYPTEEVEEPQLARVINPDDDLIRKLYDDLQRAVDLEATDIAERIISVRPTSIRFPAASAVLGDQAEKYLHDLALDLRQNLQNQPIKIYVTCSADVSVDRRQRLLLSARRAEAVERRLRGLLQPELHKGLWEIHSLGTGTDPQQVEPPTGPAEQGLITITLLGKKG
ncbi:MAG TPA: flagellar motor protein MotB [Phycisphaerae bacterium]|nr:flagellar motor protein MotB [Phycisphaerae bacterium]